MEARVIAGWKNGDYVGLSDEVVARLTGLKAQGYELVVKPKLSIGGRNPEPDFLFIKKDGPDFNFDDCIYIDNKYFYDVDFTIAQKEIVKPFLNGGTEAVVTMKVNVNDDLGNRIISIDDELKIRKIEIFTIREDFNLGVINKYPKP